MIEFEKVINIIDMLKSSDIENHTMGLSLLERLDYEKNKLPLMLCWKYGNSSREEWQSNCPNAYQFISDHVFKNNNKHITVKDVMVTASLTKADLKYIEFTLNKLALTIQDMFIIKGTVKISIENEN